MIKDSLENFISNNKDIVNWTVLPTFFSIVGGITGYGFCLIEEPNRVIPTLGGTLLGSVVGIGFEIGLRKSCTYYHNNK